MSWGAVAGGAIVAGAGLLSSKMNSDAAKAATNAQKSGTKAALAEAQRQYDEQMAEYRRKSAIIEQQQGQVIQNLAPYVQGGQGAYYQMLALSGLAAPVGAEVQPQQQQVLGVALPSGVNPSDVAAELGKGGLSLSSAQWDKVSPGTTSPRYYAAQLVQKTQAAHPEWIGQQVMDEVGTQLSKVPPQSTMTTTPTAASPYAGMTGEQAQQAAISRIAESPLLQELTKQGEQAILQQSAATGGLRGGNVQGALAQYRPQMLQNAIDQQYSRLAGLSGTGLQATTANPVIQTTAGSMPSGANIGSYLQNLGSVNAAGINAQNQAGQNALTSIAQGVGYGLNKYNQPQATTNAATGAASQGGVQAAGIDAYGNVIPY